MIRIETDKYRAIWCCGACYNNQPCNCPDARFLCQEFNYSQAIIRQ